MEQAGDGSSEQRKGEKARQESSPPALVLVHSSEDSFKNNPVAERLKESDTTLLREPEPFVGRDLWQADVVLLGASDPPNLFGRREMNRAVQFVRSGGGLVVLSTRSPRSRKAREQGMPVRRLLPAFGLGSPGGSLRVSSQAPKGTPKDVLLCSPASAHPIVRGLQKVAFPEGSSPLALRGSGAPLLVTHRFVKGARGGPPYLLAAALQHGDGRVVVFSRKPSTDSAGPQGIAATVRAVLWAADRR